MFLAPFTALLVVTAPPGRENLTRYEVTAFRNCAAARAAGAAPLFRGQQGYGSHLDRDNDGVACEPYKGNRSGGARFKQRRR